jgi:hypothetical protein
MIGIRSGAVTQLKKINKHITSVHCCAHKINLASYAAIKIASSGEIKDWSGLLYRIWNFFYQSSKRCRVLLKNSEDNVRLLKLQRACKSRWESVEKSSRALKYRFVHVCKALDYLSNIESDKDYVKELLQSLKKIDTLIAITVLNVCLPVTKRLNKKWFFKSNFLFS